jgi:hypothetical protein
MGCTASHAVVTMDEPPQGVGLHRQQGGIGTVPSARPARQDFTMKLYKHPGEVLGAGLGNTEKGAVIFNVTENCLLDEWNRNNPDQIVEPGFTITEVNGVTGYWSILEAIRQPGELIMKVTSAPPRNAGPNWFEDVVQMGKTIQQSGVKNSFMLRLQCPDSTARSTNFSSLPTVRAGECGVDQCAICMDDIAPEQNLVQLPCSHAFHPLCAARWLTQAGRGSNKRQCCPLCNRKIVSTPDGELTVQEPNVPSSR